MRPTVMERSIQSCNPHKPFAAREAGVPRSDATPSQTALEVQRSSERFREIRLLAAWMARPDLTLALRLKHGWIVLAPAFT